MDGQLDLHGRCVHLFIPPTSVSDRLQTVEEAMQMMLC